MFGKLTIELKEERIHHNGHSTGTEYGLTCSICGCELFRHEEYNPGCTCDYCLEMINLDSEIEEIESAIKSMNGKE